jgi:hypothetical protein
MGRGKSTETVDMVHGGGGGVDDAVFLTFWA